MFARHSPRQTVFWQHDGSPRETRNGFAQAGPRQYVHVAMSHSPIPCGFGVMPAAGMGTARSSGLQGGRFCVMPPPGMGAASSSALQGGRFCVMPAPGTGAGLCVMPPPGMGAAGSSVLQGSRFCVIPAPGMGAGGTSVFESHG